MEIFKGQNFLDFTERFKTDLDYEEYLFMIKWEKGFSCRKCGHKRSQIRRDFSRTCNICSDTESPNSGTLFHKVKFGLRNAFFICFEMSATTKDLSVLQMSIRYGISENTARLFMHKVREAMKSRESNGMKGTVYVDEFTVGRKEENKQERSYNTKKKKIICALETTDDGKVKRFYAEKIKEFSTKSLKKIFEKYIDKTANVITDEWKGYRPIKNYNIKQFQVIKDKVSQYFIR